MSTFDLTRERLNRGWSRRQAAREIGVSAYALKSLEEGRAAHPSNAKTIADYFGVHVTDLMPVEEAAA